MNINKRVAAGIGLIAGALGLYLLTKKAKPTCTEGATKCDAGNLYACVNGKWELQELNSPVCVVPVSCSIDADCPPGYVCENGVCVPQTVNHWEIYGKITDAQTKAPIPSVMVTMYKDGGKTEEVIASTVGDNVGNYRISGTTDASVGNVTLVFVKEGYATQLYWKGSSGELNASLTPKQYAQSTLYGTITDDKGNPLNGVTFTFYWDGEAHPYGSSAIVGPTYSLESVSPGQWRLVFEKQGYRTWDETITVPGGEEVKYDIVLAQIWDWEGIYQPSDYMTKWEEMVAAQGMEAVIDDISQIPGMPVGYEKVNIYDPQPFRFTEIVENHLPEYITGWAEATCGGSFPYGPPTGYEITFCDTAFGKLGIHGGCPRCIMSKVRCDQIPSGFAPFVPTRDPAEKYDACVHRSECYGVPSIEGLDNILASLSESTVAYIAHQPECKRRVIEMELIRAKYNIPPFSFEYTCSNMDFLPYTNNLIVQYHVSDEDAEILRSDYKYLKQWNDWLLIGIWIPVVVPGEYRSHWDSLCAGYLNYIAVYAECKRHSSGASSFYIFWDNLGVSAYRNEYGGVIGYIFYDKYGSGIGWDVDYRSDRWKTPYKTGELLHYV